MHGEPHIPLMLQGFRVDFAIHNSYVPPILPKNLFKLIGCLHFIGFPLLTFQLYVITGKVCILGIALTK